MIVKLLCLLWFLPWLNTLAGKWPLMLDESVDERQDAEIFRSVVESMKQWELHKKSLLRSKREASRVCYEDVGCFEDTGPFSYLEMLPSPPKEVGTRFFVYGSRKARSAPMEVPADDINEKASNAIDPDLPTKVIVHGFGSNCDHVWVYEMRSALMSVHDCNIVCVDWSRGSAIPNYVRAAANARLVGRQLAKLVRSLNVPLDKVHLIGFSLGAHVAGFAGAELANVSRITGLDPAGPLFESQDPQVRLDETDANFVDVIHSNGEQLILGGLGSWQPMGDVDFYPNGGRMQTGCSNLFLGAVSDFIWSGTIEGRSLCNHRRAYKLFTDSVSPKCRFPAFSCEKGYDGLLQGECFPCGPDRPCGDMGYYSDVSAARGQLYLVTRDEEPFCAHQYQIKVFNSQSERPARSYGKLQVTLVGSGSFNETFTMTRKDDEELLVGAVLQRIVVPHPVIVNLEAIEVKYTAYSGWISSGLVSWSIDKVSILDSFGKSLSICRRGLTLESGRPIYLSLYPGECNIPIELENTTSTNTSLSLPPASSGTKAEPAMEKASNVEMKTGGIGPFTKEQNFDRKDSYLAVDIFSNERHQPRRNVGPFTKEQNLRISSIINDEKNQSDKKDKEEIISSNNKNVEKFTNFWSFVDITEAGSNSLENPEIESGRGFSGAGYILPTSATPSFSPDSTTAVESTSEIQEPVLQVTKKETGRSMRLPEITEPLLRPRITRQNMRDAGQGKEFYEEASSKSFKKEENYEEEKGFTVQFLPERLAGILAQAERYARQTFLPLISQYTPSFIGGRQERLKYFPPLIDITDEMNNFDNNFAGSSIKSQLIQKDTVNNEGIKFKNITRSNKQMNFEVNEKVKSIGKTEIDKTVNSQNFKLKDDWVPIQGSLLEKSTVKFENVSTFRSSDNHEGKWINKVIDIGYNNTNSNSNNTNNDSNNNITTKTTNNSVINSDWVPIIEHSKAEKFDIELTTKENEKLIINKTELVTSTELTTTIDSKKIDQRFIPLVDSENRDHYFTPKLTSDINEEIMDITTPSSNRLSHIQKILGPVKTRRIDENKRSTIFPYAYQREKDFRSRYIPLIPMEEIGKTSDFHNGDH